MATMRKPAEVFPPGDFLREELEERGWTQEDLAAILGRSVRTVNEIVTGRRAITPENAKALAAALGTTPEFWLNLESSWQLWRVRSDNSDMVARRSRVYSIAPVKDMTKRGWISLSENQAVLESQILAFYKLSSIEETPEFAHAARKAGSYSVTTPAQTAWLFRAANLARHVHAEAFTERGLEEGLKGLLALASAPQEARRVAKALSDIGIRFVVLEHLPGTKIDGASFWLAEGPVVALSIRYDRIDHFWFTLMHEIGHIAQNVWGLDFDIDDLRSEA